MKPHDQEEAGELLFDGAEWTPELLDRAYRAIEHIAIGEFGLDPYRSQIEVITAEQMLDAYSSVGMPQMYRHWSFGKQFAQQQAFYQKGWMGLAYEIVINSSPSVCYLMDTNTMTMQALVIAHAAFGHNHFFKNSQLFKEWTDAEGILDYLAFAKRYVASCEEKHGVAKVERVLDAAHALMGQGVFRYKHPRMSPKQELERAKERASAALAAYDDVLARTSPHRGRDAAGVLGLDELRGMPKGMLPAENVLYFVEKYAPRMAPWMRELLRIVRFVAQYFYPQGQTQVMNEGCATYVHYRIMRRLHEKGRISDGNWLEFIQSHTSVVFQPAYDDPRFSGSRFNPYALGFGMMQDIERIVTGLEVDGARAGQPCTEEQRSEDREWFPDIAGCDDVWGVLKDIWANYRDESCIRQYLSPRLMRTFRLFQIAREAHDPELSVEAIADREGFRNIRHALAEQYDAGVRMLNIEVVEANLAGDRTLILEYRAVHGVQLQQADAERTVQHLANLWGYPVELYANEDGAVDLLAIAKPEQGLFAD